MKADLRTLLRDIQAAARIGHQESVWAALEEVLEFPQISGNHHLDDSFLRQVVLPVGQTLAHPLLKQAALRPLVTHPLAGMRAIAGAALVERYLKGMNGTGLKDMGQLAQDPRQDVRQAVLLACALPGFSAPDKQTEIFEAWLVQPSPRLQGLALQLLPYLPEQTVLAQLPKLEDYSPPQEPGVRKSLAEAVSKLGQGEYGPQVLAILSTWAENPERYYWVITRALSRSWAASYPDQSLAILTHLAEIKGGRKKILNALKALQSHGAKTEVQNTMQQWRASGDSHLQSAARKAEEKGIYKKEA